VIGLEQARAIESVEKHAWRDLFAGAPPLPASALGLAGRELGGAFALTAPAIESFLFNRVIGLGVDRPATEAALDAMMAHYETHGTSFEVTLCPLAEPADLGPRLAARGLDAPFHHVKWVRGVEAVQPRATTLRLERVKPRDGRRFGSVAAEVFAFGLVSARDWLASCVGRPGWTHYVTLDGDEPAGCGALYVEGEGAWIGWGATHEAHRRKGSQALLLAARVRDAAAAGCQWVSTESGPNWPDVDTTAWRAMDRAGFTVAYERPCHIRV
jgi:GNAT superfamily N-acetyltransferase